MTTTERQAQTLGRAHRETSQVAATLTYLRHCQKARSAGASVSYTTDPAWLVMMAINRRAGWPDDPTTTRGSCLPVNGKYPVKAAGDHYRAVEHLAQAVNMPRRIVRESECPKHLRARLTHRFFRED